MSLPGSPSESGHLGEKNWDHRAAMWTGGLFRGAGPHPAAGLESQHPQATRAHSNGRSLLLASSSQSSPASSPAHITWELIGNAGSQACTQGPLGLNLPLIESTGGSWE